MSKIGWVELNSDGWTRVDKFRQGWMGGWVDRRVDGWLWGRRVGAGVDGWLRMGGRVAKNGWTGGLKWV